MSSSIDIYEKQCSNCAFWRHVNQGERTGMCVCSKSVSHKQLTLDTDGCKYFEQEEDES